MKPYTTIPIFTLRVVREPSVRYAYPTVGNHTAASAALQAVLQDRATEHLCALMLDGKHNNLGVAMVAQGGIHGLHVQVRDVLTPVLLHRAAAFILAHNHPSGDTEPSPEDMAFTQSCYKLAKELGCPMLDHIIISSGINRGESYSFMDHGRMP